MKKSEQYSSNSLKTFYLYLGVVFVLICISLLIKGFFIVQQSRFDGTHDFTLALTEQNNVKEVVSFHPQTPSIAVLIIQDAIPYVSLAQKYGIATDGFIQTNDASTIGPDMTTFMWLSILHTGMWQSNVTVFDKFRLFLLAKGTTTNNKTVEKISLSHQSPDMNTILVSALTDQDIANENISVQIINATDISGFGQRLGRVLTNMGTNVVDVSTAQNTQKTSTIAYFGNESYTLDRLQRMLGLRAIKLTKQSIADIIITIGNDMRSTSAF